MEEILTPAMKEAISALGELIKADPRHLTIQEAIETYEKSEELNGLIAEYNTQQNLLSDLYGQNGADVDKDAQQTIQTRIDQLYDQITSHPVYAAYIEAKNAFDGLTNEVYAELQFVITGQRPCSHDCSSCGGCGHEH